MSISIVQTAKNQSAYQVQPLSVTLKAATTALSYLAVVVEAQKSGYPFASGSIVSNTPSPTVTDDKGTVYTLVDKIVSIAQDPGQVTSPPTTPGQPDAAGYFQSAYIYVSSTAVTAGAQNVYVSAFYPDEVLSPPVNGRPVFDGGLHAQVFEVAGLSTGVDQHSNGVVYAPTNPNLGPNLITTTGAALIIEVGVLLDSAALVSNTNSVQQHASILYGGSSHFVVQTRLVGSATASTGFGNALLYSGGVVAVSLK